MELGGGEDDLERPGLEGESVCDGSFDLDSIQGRVFAGCGHGEEIPIEHDRPPSTGPNRVQGHNPVAGADVQDRPPGRNAGSSAAILSSLPRKGSGPSIRETVLS